MKPKFCFCFFLMRRRDVIVIVLLVGGQATRSSGHVFPGDPALPAAASPPSTPPPPSPQTRPFHPLDLSVHGPHGPRLARRCVRPTRTTNRVSLPTLPRIKIRCKLGGTCLNVGCIPYSPPRYCVLHSPSPCAIYMSIGKNSSTSIRDRVEHFTTNLGG